MPVRLRYLVLAVALGAAAQAVWAKLPPPSPEAKAAAEAAAAKAAWTNKVAAYQLCKAQERVAAHYLSSAKAAGKDVKPVTATPACTDPGPYEVAAAEKQKPIEAAGAHSPPETAKTPPNTKQPEAEIKPAKKP